MFWLKASIIVIVVSILGWGIYDLIAQTRMAQKEADTWSATLKKTIAENKILNEKIEYFKNPDNLVKEAKSQFNYRKPDEKLIIITPPETATPSE